jgi:AraC-like DNA-binding protein
MKTSYSLSTPVDLRINDHTPSRTVLDAREQNMCAQRARAAHAHRGMLEPLGFVAQLCLAAPTPEDALFAACRTSSLWSALPFQLRRDREFVSVQGPLRDDEYDCAFVRAASSAVFLWLELLERVAGAPIYPHAVHLPALEREDREHMRAALSCTVYFEQPLIGLSFRAPDLRVANDACDARLFQLLSEYAEDRLGDREGQQSTAERLCWALRQLDDVSSASAESLAAALGLGMRTLHRRLRAEGTSYRSVLEEFRMQRCLTQLSVSGASAKRIAFSLGFANPASFHRAFKRWTGRTVGEYRRAHLTQVKATNEPLGADDRIAS